MAQTTNIQTFPNASVHSTLDSSLPGAIPKLQTTEKDSTSNGINHQDDLIFHELPPFPSHIPTAPLLRLSLQKLLDHDADEEKGLFRACCEVGFFYLDLRGAQPPRRDSIHQDQNEDDEINGDGLLRNADELFKLGEQVFRLPTEEKQTYDFKDQGSYFGYKGLGAGIVDAQGTRDRNEFYNVSKDDVLGQVERLPAPEVLQKESNRELLRSFVRRSHAIINLLLSIINTHLGLPANRLPSLHRLRGISGDQVRWVHSPPQPMDDRKLALGEHTDFGSMTVLFNRLGGLQILPPGEGEWCYVKPLKGHCVVNLGDAMVKFTAGILRSNIHRVVNPPGEQGDRTRMSLVYFARPEDEVLLKVLEGSDLIDEKRRQHAEFAEEELVTAKEWVLRRAMGRRSDGDWEKSGGTEGDRLK